MGGLRLPSRDCANHHESPQAAAGRLQNRPSSYVDHSSLFSRLLLIAVTQPTDREPVAKRRREQLRRHQQQHATKLPDPPPRLDGSSPPITSLAPEPSSVQERKFEKRPPPNATCSYSSHHPHTATHRPHDHTYKNAGLSHSRYSAHQEPRRPLANGGQGERKGHPLPVTAWIARRGLARAQTGINPNNPPTSAAPVARVPSEASDSTWHAGC